MVSKVPIFTSCFLSLKTLWHLDILTHSSSSPPPPLLLHIFSLLSTFRTFCVIPLSAAEQKKIALSQLYPYCSPGIMDQIRTFTLMPQRWLSLCIKQKRKNKKTSHLTPSGIRNDIHLVQSRVEKVGVILPCVKNPINKKNEPLVSCSPWFIGLVKKTGYDMRFSLLTAVLFPLSLCVTHPFKWFLSLSLWWHYLPAFVLNKRSDLWH